MGRKALFVVACWLTLSQTFCDKRLRSSAVLDNESAESAPRLYRNVPLGVYASAAPYAAYSYHLPTFVAAPKSAASQVIPVKENFVNGLTDSYGNRFVGTPQLSSYKIAFPQQFVPLQTKLPEHLSQPLVAAAANFQFNKQANGQFFGTPYRVSTVQSPAPTPLNHFPTFGQLYGGKTNNLAPVSVLHTQAFRIPNSQQQPTNNKVVFTNTQSHEQYNNYKIDPKHTQQKEPQIIVGKPKEQSIPEVPHASQGETKFQRIQEAPHTSHSEPKFQKNQESSHSHYGDLEFKKGHESHHSEPKVQQHESHSSHDEVKYSKVKELPHYESKFQIIEEKPHQSQFQVIEEKPHSSQFQRIQDHFVPLEEVKFERVHEASPVSQKQHTYERSQEKQKHKGHGDNAHYSQSNKAKLQSNPNKQTITYINDINGKKTIVEVETNPNMHLLDLTLLEPLTFDNPIVPQVQHFLPKINQATYQKLPEAVTPGVKNYQKEFVVQKTTSYDSDEVYDKPLKEAPKKKHKKTTLNKYPKKNEAPKKTTVTYHETLGDAPEIVYEINTPNHKETIKEKVISYNKQTHSQPVHYSYGSKSEKDPVTYSYSRTSKEPVNIKSVEYHGNGPSHLIYNFKPEEQSHAERPHSSAQQPGEAENDKEPSHESDDYNPGYHHQQHHTNGYKEHPKSSEEHYEPAHNEKNSYNKQSEENHGIVVHDSPPKYYSEPTHFTSENINFQPIIKEYENNIRSLTAPSASIKVDPFQQVQQVKSTPQPNVKQHEEHSQHQYRQPHSSPTPQEHYHSTPEPQIHQRHSNDPSHQRHSNDHSHHHHPNDHSHQQRPSDHSNQHHNNEHSHQRHLNTPPETFIAQAPHVHEKSKRVIIQEEAPDEMHTLREQSREEVVQQGDEENNEEDFEKAYHNAAIGFPAYNKKPSESEKEIFDPESYGIPRDHAEYDFENTPFQQYQEEGDEFPKESRSSYKDARDKMKQNYYTEFSISKPESLLDKYQNQLGYYKLFKERKPDYLVASEDDKTQKSARYTVAPSFGFSPSQDKAKSYFGIPKQTQNLYEYDYSKGFPRDNSAFASRPQQVYKTRTRFVEPQFQYGFEPLSIPKLLDSELAAMASNDSPESEKPGMRKKLYKENWYIKKTTTTAGAPVS